MALILITCPHCGLSKDVPEKRIPKAPVKVTCPKCRNQFVYHTESRSAAQIQPVKKPARPLTKDASPSEETGELVNKAELSPPLPHQSQAENTPDTRALPYMRARLVRSNSPLLRILLCIVLCLIILVIACGVLYAYYNRGQSPWYKFSFSNNYKVGVDPPSISVRGTLKPTLSDQDRKDLRDLFEKRQFDSLNKIASDIQLAFERDTSYEYKVCDFYEIFDSTLPEYEELLDAWVAYSPMHFAPYLARAQYCYYCSAPGTLDTR